jgi:hypothetical protein
MQPPAQIRYTSSVFTPHINPHIATDETMEAPPSPEQLKKIAEQAGLVRPVPSVPNKRLAAFDVAEAKAVMQNERAATAAAAREGEAAQAPIMPMGIPQIIETRQPTVAEQQQELMRAYVAAMQAQGEAAAMQAQLPIPQPMMQASAGRSYILGTPERTAAVLVAGLFGGGMLVGWYFFGRSKAAAETAQAVTLSLSDAQARQIVSEAAQEVMKLITK